MRQREEFGREEQVPDIYGNLGTLRQRSIMFCIVRRIFRLNLRIRSRTVDSEVGLDVTPLLTRGLLHKSVPDTADGLDDLWVIWFVL